jgi:hypothetical protein
LQRRLPAFRGGPESDCDCAQGSLPGKNATLFQSRRWLLRVERGGLNLFLLTSAPGPGASESDSAASQAAQLSPQHPWLHPSNKIASPPRSPSSSQPGTDVGPKLVPTWLAGWAGCVERDPAGPQPASPDRQPQKWLSVSKRSKRATCSYSTEHWGRYSSIHVT